MTNTIDFGFGWDPSKEFNISELETTTLQQIEQQVFTQAQSKAAYLEMQQAVQNKEVENLKNLIGLHKEYLTASRWKTLGRLAIKNFSEEIVSVLTQCPWDDIFSDDLTMWCVTNDQDKAFDFAVKTWTADKSKGAQKIKNTYELLMAVTPANYLLYDKYRPHLFKELTPPQKDEAAKELLRHLHKITPKSAVAFKQIFAELSTANWSNVFQNQTPYYCWQHPSNCFGLSLLLHQHPDLSEQLAKTEKLLSLKVKRMENIALNTIFKIGLHEPIGFSARLDDVFQKEFATFCAGGPKNVLHNRYMEYITPYMLLNSPQSATENFKSRLLEFCAKNQIPFTLKRSNGVECLIQNSNEFVCGLVKSDDGKTVLHALLQKAENAYELAQCITTMKVQDAMNVLPHVSFAPNNSGLTLAHHIASHIAMGINNNSWANPRTHLIQSELVDWEALSVSGESAKGYLLSKIKPENIPEYTQLFQQRQAKILHNTAHKTRADNNLTTATSTQRKM